MTTRNNQLSEVIENIYSPAQEMHESFIKVRECYRKMLYILRDACIIDADYAKNLFCISRTDAYLLRQPNIDKQVLDETLAKNDHLFSFSFPQKSREALLSQKVQRYHFLDRRFIPLVSRYRDVQRDVCVHLKNITKLNPMIAQQLFRAEAEDIRACDDLCIVDFISIAERHHWLIKLNNKNNSEIFRVSAKLRSHSRGIVDSALQTGK